MAFFAFPGPFSFRECRATHHTAAGAAYTGTEFFAQYRDHGSMHTPFCACRGHRLAASDRNIAIWGHSTLLHSYLFVQHPDRNFDRSDTRASWVSRDAELLGKSRCSAINPDINHRTHSSNTTYLGSGSKALISSIDWRKKIRTVIPGYYIVSANEVIDN